MKIEIIESLSRNCGMSSSERKLLINLLGCIHIWSVDIPGPFYGDLQLISASECSAGAALVSLDSCMAGIPVSLKD